MEFWKNSKITVEEKTDHNHHLVLSQRRYGLLNLCKTKGGDFNMMMVVDPWESSSKDIAFLSSELKQIGEESQCISFDGRTKESLILCTEFSGVAS